MKTSLLRTLAIAGVVVMAATPAMAKGDLVKQRRAAEDAAYWQSRINDSGSVQRINATDSKGQAATARSNVSQYPCARCVYDSAQGGYVLSPSKKN